MNALITATLDLSRFETKRVPLDVQLVDVPLLMREVAAEIASIPGRPDVQLQWDIDRTVPRLHTDPLKLKMVLRNLVTNAVKYTDRGAVMISARPTETGVEVRVADTGIGIPPGSLDSIFDPFEQAHGSESRQRGGAGLGLYIVKRLVDVLGGSIAVESDVGRGSTFCVSLPRAIAKSRS
jgi:signal transduction histidine kinase